MATTKKSQITPAKLELYEKLIATVPTIDRKGAVHPYTSMNGHMFTYLDQTGTLGMRLPKDELEAQSFLITPYDSNSPVLYFFRKAKELRKYLQISFEYLTTLKPKSQR